MPRVENANLFLTAYLRTQSQEILDFAVVVSYAVPNLRGDLKRAKNNKQKHVSFRPDYFNKTRQPVSQLLHISKDYKSKLSKYVIISNFSFFESYVRDAFEEVLEFHGGVKEFPSKTRAKSVQRLSTATDEVKKHKRKLQEHPKPGKEGKYQKYGKILSEADYPFPSELFASFGINHLATEIRERNFKSLKIPQLLRDAFLMDVSEIDEKEFNRIRGIRNRIGHGKTVNASLRDAMIINKFLRDFAQKIDNHLVTNFLVVENSST